VLWQGDHEHEFSLVQFQKYDTRFQLTMWEPRVQMIVGAKEHEYTHSRAMLAVAVAVLYPVLLGCGSVINPVTKKEIYGILYSWANQRGHFHSALTVMRTQAHSTATAASADAADSRLWFGVFVAECVHTLGTGRQRLFLGLEQKSGLIGGTGEHKGYWVLIQDVTVSSRNTVCMLSLSQAPQRSDLYSLTVRVCVGSSGRRSEWPRDATSGLARQQLRTLIRRIWTGQLASES
jgi:hypothetical protein